LELLVLLTDQGIKEFLLAKEVDTNNTNNKHFGQN
jgi:hypothetical protein